ncbi:MAG: hypothetical protein P1P90_06145 [Patescibacteria group bacterium]|nr:hypothetical protein [Patescibacteria group bacterium]
MPESSSNPPIIKNSKAPQTMASNLRIADNQPSTADIIVRDGLLRDTWVSLRRPCPISEFANPKHSLIIKVIEYFRKQNVCVNAAQVSEILDILIEKNLVQYLPEKHCYVPTEKTQHLMDDIYIVFCDNCGASNVKLRETRDEIPTLLFCHRCEEIV